MFNFKNNEDREMKERIFRGGTIIIMGRKRGDSSDKIFKDMKKAGYSNDECLEILKIVLDFAKIMDKDPHKYDKEINERKMDWR